MFPVAHLWTFSGSLCLLILVGLEIVPPAFKAALSRVLRTLTSKSLLSEIFTYRIFYPGVQTGPVDTTESLIYGRCHQGSKSVDTELIKGDIFFLGESDLSRGPFKETEIAAGVLLLGGRSSCLLWKGLRVLLREGLRLVASKKTGVTAQPTEDA